MCLKDMGIIMNKKNKRLFYKYLISYFIVFLIPFIAISAVFYHTSVQNLRDEITKFNTDKVEQAKEFLDTRMKELEGIANRISLDNQLTPYMFKDPYDSKQAIKELTSYKVNSGIVDELYLHYNGDNQIYSPRGSVRVDTFINLAYPFAHEEGSRFVERLKSTTMPSVKLIELRTSNSKTKHLISYLYPIPTDSAVPYGTVAFIVKEEAISKMIGNALGDSKGNIYVYNSENELLASAHRGENLGDRTVSKLSKNEPGITDMTINKEDYSVVTVHSDVSDWTFVMTIPTEQFYVKMSNLKKSITITLLIVAFVGAIVTIYMAFRQYRPIQRIVQSLRTKKIENTSKSKKKNELERIQETIEHIHKDSEQLQEQIKVHQPFIRDQLLSHLLNGEKRDAAYIKEMLHDINIVFKGQYYFTTVVSLRDRINNNRSIKEREQVVSFLMKVSFQQCVGYGVELIHDNAVAVIVSLDETESDIEQTQQQFMSALKQQLATHSKQTLAIGVGKVYQSIEFVNRSFVEANVALEYNVLNNTDRAMYFEDMGYQESSLWYPQEDQATFVQSLKQGDQAVANETLKSIINNLKEQNTSIHMLRAMCFELINTIFKTTLELDIEPNKEMTKKLVQFKSLEDLEKTIQTMIIHVCEAVEKRKASHNDSLRDGILRYIHEEFRSRELSVESTAKTFQVSVSYLSRFMKEQTGSTFTQYIGHLRHEAFKKQLIETNKPIKELVLEVGYVDVANFTRRFKKKEGLPPGQYRKVYSKRDRSIDNQ